MKIKINFTGKYVVSISIFIKGRDKLINKI